MVVTHEHQTLCCYTNSHLNTGTYLQVNLKSFICILAGKSEKPSQRDSTQSTTTSKAFVRARKARSKLSLSQTPFQLTPSRHCTTHLYCCNRDTFTSTLPSGNPNLFCTTAVSSRMRRPFSPRTF